MASPQRMIVTGAAQGIGRAVALRLAAHGVHLAVWDVQRNGVEETAKLCRAGWLSMMIGWCIDAESRSATVRATRSRAPPAAVVTTTWIGFDG